MNNEINGKILTASIAAAIISDTPIVSIAGSTLSEITTTTTSTTTTPTPTPTPTNFDPSNKHQNHHHQHNKKKTLSNPMSDATAHKSAGGIGTTAIAAAPTTTSVVADVSSNVGAGHTKYIETSVTTTAIIGKVDDANVAVTADPSKKSDILEDSCINELNEPDLQKLLEEAYTYKTPKDKENKSEIFLSLLQKVENEDRGITSNTSENHRHHPHSQNRHQQKQGGSLQDLVLLPADYRRQTSRNKKVSSVSSRQREGGSLPSNVNVANCLLSSAFDQQQSVFGDKHNRRRTFLLGVDVATATQNLSFAGNNNGVSTTSHNAINCKENSSTTGAAIAAAATTGSGTAAAVTAGSVANNSNTSGGGDYIINIGDCMMDIQQQQQILQSKTIDIGSKGVAFYERVELDRRIPRNSLHRTDTAEFATTRSHNYVDETIRFPQIDAGANADNDYLSDAISSVGGVLKSATSCPLPMPLDEHYRSIKSVMGEKGESNQGLKWTPMANGSSSSSNSNSGSSSSSGFTFAKALTRQTDENGNDCDRQLSNSIYVNAGQSSQSKAKAKKKLQKNNTKTVDLLNVAGYRGYDPVEELVKYIENTDDLNNKHGSGSGKLTESKKKERKKDKEKNSKMKKSNSLEELRSCAKIDVDDLKRSAATTESNNVTMRSKAGGAKSGKNNSASAADINKNFDGSNTKEIATTVNSGKQSTVADGISTTTTITTVNNRKGERRSWGTEELQYLGESGSNNIGNIDEKKEKKSKGKEKEKEKVSDKDEQREKTVNIIDCNVDCEKSEKLDKTEKFGINDKSEKLEKSERRKKSENVSAASAFNVSAQENSLPVSVISESPVIAPDKLSIDTLVPETAEFHVVTKKKKPKKQRNSSEEGSYNNSNNNNNNNFNRAHNFTFNNTQKVSNTQAFITQQQPNRQKSHNNHAGHMFGTQVNNEGRVDHHNNNSHQPQQTYGNQQHQANHHHQQQQSSVTSHNNGGSDSNGSTIGDKSRRKSTSSVPPSEKSDSSDLDSVHSLPIESTTKSKQRHKNGQTSASPETPKPVSGNSPPAPISYADIAAAADRSWPSLEPANSHNNNVNSHNNSANSHNSTANSHNSTANSHNSSVISHNSSINSHNSSMTSSSLNSSLEPQATNVDCDLRSSSTTIQNSSAAIVNNVPTAALAINPPKFVRNKKLTCKPDFPELVSTIATTANNSSSNSDISAKSSNTTYKSISYSQSLTTTPVILNTTTVSTSTSDVPITGSALPTLSSGSDPKHEKRSIAAETNKNDVISNNVIASTSRVLQTQQQQQSQQQQQQPQQHLQKSKSVEHDSYNYNSSNIDQQYPALEKTVKRHSANNVSLGSVTNATIGCNILPASQGYIGTTNTSPSAVPSVTQFNFAAAAKQQVIVSTTPRATTASLCQIGQPSVTATALPINAPATATTSNVPIAPTTTSIGTATAVLPTPPTTATITRKSKEKSPTIVATTVINQNNAYNNNTNNVQPLVVNTADGSNTLVRKAKKEKQQQTLPYEFGALHPALTSEHSGQKSTTATQTNAITFEGNESSHVSMATTSDKNSRNSHSNASNVKLQRSGTAAVSSHCNPQHVSRSQKASVGVGANVAAITAALPTASVGNINSNTVIQTNRPAVIIMNDNRGDSGAVSMEFTFGDFNEDELKFFDESIIDDEDVGCGDELTDYYNDDQGPPSRSTVSSIAYFNDSGVAADISNANSAYTDGFTFSGDNMSPLDSGKIHKSLKNLNKGHIVGNSSETHHNRKLSSCSSTPSAGIKNNTTIDGNNEGNSCCPLPQQLETCNDIETAIIAAARAAATADQQVQSTHHRKHDQLPYVCEIPKQQPQRQKDLSMQVLYIRDAANAHSHHQHHQHQYHHSNQPQVQPRLNYSHSNSSNCASRSRSSSGNDIMNNNSSYDSSNSTISIQRKELDIHFIPPSTSTAMSALQHNDTIVDFIGSAWEEVAKVTKFYDGQ